MNLHEVCNIYGDIVAGAISSVVWGISAVVGGAKRSTRKLKEISKNLGRGCREMTAIRKGGMTHFESHHPKFLHKKRWLTTTIFLRYML